MSLLKLGVNIDHVATLRQSRYVGQHTGRLAEPDPLEAARVCEQAGAHSITVHLRADRRHIQDSDVNAVRVGTKLRLNLEMGVTPEISEIALQIRPDDVCLVPEDRREVTTEGGLDVVGQEGAVTAMTAALQSAGIRVSLFVDPEPAQIEACLRTGAEMIELHTGAFSNAVSDAAAADLELKRLALAAREAHTGGLQVNAGHGINYVNIGQILKLPHLAELNIGHSIVSRAVFVGLDRAVREMLSAMASYQGGA